MLDFCDVNTPASKDHFVYLNGVIVGLCQLAKAGDPGQALVYTIKEVSSDFALAKVEPKLLKGKVEILTKEEGLTTYPSQDVDSFLRTGKETDREVVMKCLSRQAKLFKSLGIKPESKKLIKASVYVVSKSGITPYVL